MPTKGATQHSAAEEEEEKKKKLREGEAAGPR